MRKRVMAGGLAVAGVVGAVVMAAPLAADPEGSKDCGGPDLKNGLKTDTAAQVAEPNWSQKFGTINDESCLNRTAVRGIVAAKTEADVAGVLAWARAKSLPVTAAGVKHSMGGQAFTKGGVVLDMTKMNAIKLDPVGMTVTVGAGARWHDIQNAIHPRFAIKAMQSTDVFTVGGSPRGGADGIDPAIADDDGRWVDQDRLAHREC
jgi:FAD/FMN-containing dehydrogenase